MSRRKEKLVAELGHPKCVGAIFGQTLLNPALIVITSHWGGVRSIVMDMFVCVFVCLSVCLSARITGKPHDRTPPYFVHVAYTWLGPLLSVLRYVIICASGCVDDVTFTYDGPMARHVDSKASIEQDKLNSRDSNQIFSVIKTSKYTHRLTVGEVCYL